MREKHATGQVHIGGMTFDVTDVELSDGRADLSIVTAEGEAMSVPIPCEITASTDRYAAAIESANCRLLGQIQADSEFDATVRRRLADLRDLDDQANRRAWLGYLESCDAAWRRAGEASSVSNDLHSARRKRNRILKRLGKRRTP